MPASLQQRLVYCSETRLIHTSVTHVIHSVPTAQEELPRILAGETLKPSSGLGSDAQSPRASKPEAVVVGAGYSVEEVQELQKISGAETVPWFRGNPDLTNFSKFRDSIPPTSHIAERAKAVMKSHEVDAAHSGAMPRGSWEF